MTQDMTENCVHLLDCGCNPYLQKRKLSAAPALEALGSPQERGLLYEPELQSVADRVRYIERAHSR